MGKFTGKVVLVTGGGSGIGLAIVKAFLAEDAKVAITGRNVEKLQTVAKELNVGDRLYTHATDVAEVTQVKTLIETVIKKLGPIDILVNNAGTNLKERTFRELTTEAWDRLVRTNLDGAFYCIHAVFPGMAARKEGHIINISSVAGLRASPLGGLAYAASKFGMTALGIGLAAEEKDSGVRVSNIFPGEVDTPILEFRPAPITEEHRSRILRPEDIAAGVMFVASLPPHVSVPELIIKPTSQVYI